MRRTGCAETTRPCPQQDRSHNGQHQRSERIKSPERPARLPLQSGPDATSTPSIGARWTGAELVVEAEATIPTEHGLFRFIVFRHADDFAKEQVAIVAGDVSGDDVLVRIHSECMTSEVFGSLKCDCAGQLDRACATSAGAAEACSSTCDKKVAGSV